MLPACTVASLNALSKINDALTRQGIPEACLYASDMIVLIQNELDWCFHTDTTLPFMHAYFSHLQDALAQLPQFTPREIKVQVAKIIQTNEQTIARVGRLEQHQDKERAGDNSVDATEIEYRQRQHRETSQTGHT